MQALLPDGSVINWPEWAQTVPQNCWTKDQVEWMAAHQQRVLDMQQSLQSQLAEQQQ